MNFLLIAVGKLSLLLKDMVILAVLKKRRAHLLGPSAILLHLCRVNIYLLKF